MVKTVAISGAGDVAKYVVEELGQKGHKDVLISLLHDNGPFYNEAHLAMTFACNSSGPCKRFIPSECGGNIEDFPQHPLFYVPTHGAIRKVLAAQKTFEYTLFNIGWFMDYFAPRHTYMKPLPGIWPLDLVKKELRLLGTGDEAVTFTAARDAGRALAHLVDVPKWETYTYIAGETTTWNEVWRSMQQPFHTSFTVTQRTLQEIKGSIDEHQDDSDIASLWLDYMDLWNATGAAGCRFEETKRQSREIFGGMIWMTVDDLLEKAASFDGVI